MALTEDQQLVVDLADGYNLCCALPGSGKTHTSIEVCRKILETDSGYTMIMVTFTNAAAKEMSARLQGKLPAELYARVKVATFHALALQQSKQLKNKGKLCIGPPQTGMLIRAIRQSGFPGKFEDATQFLDAYGVMVVPQPLPDDVFGGWKLFQTYISLMERHNQRDFNMICRDVRIGLANGNIKPYPHSHILVDEFQDVDETQVAWIVAHGQHGAKITVVGDDDQSIYGFRGSKGYEAMQLFQQEFDAVGHVLSICFRCRPEILLAAKQVIEFNEERIPKEMTTAMDAGGKVEIRSFDDKDAQADYILNAVQQHEGEWAVLARTNLHLDFIEMLLQSHRIPVQRLGGKSFWEVPDVDAFLKLLYCLRRPDSPRFLNEVLGWLEEDEDVIFDICKQAKHLKGFSNVAVDEQNWRPVTIWFHQYWVQLGMNTEDPSMISRRMMSIIGKCRESKGKKPDEGLGPAAAVADMISSNAEGDLCERIDSFIYRLDGRAKAAQDEEENKGVTLATMHGSKGLEWENVIVASCSDGVIPSEKASSIDEERRLLYVVMTRAEQSLSLCYFGKPSEFLTQAFAEALPVPDAA